MSDLEEVIETVLDQREHFDTRYYIAETPCKKTVFTCRDPTQKAPVKCLVAYKSDSRELGVLHWTSNTRESYMNRVISNNLNLSAKWGVPLSLEDLYVLDTDETSNVPSDAIQPINFVSAANPKRNGSRKKVVKVERIDVELGEIVEEIPEPEVVEPVEIVEEIKEVIKEEIPRFEKKEVSLEEMTFRTKKAAVAKAKEHGYSVENVLRDENNRRKWVIIPR